MRRRDFIAGLGWTGAASLVPARLRAQGTLTYRLGVLISTARSASNWIAFFDELRSHGLIEGSNATTVGFDIAPDRLDAAAKEMVYLGSTSLAEGL
jgi:hypothetical protein